MNVPALNGPECAEIIRTALNGVSGVRDIAIDLTNKTVTVTYDRLNIADRNIELVVSAAGFDANATLANPQAYGKLTDNCK